MAEIQGVDDHHGGAGALAQSSNDFYSRQKNTDEMIKMANLLRCRYRACSRIYLSWDAASWAGCTPRSEDRFEEPASAPTDSGNSLRLPHVIACRPTVAKWQLGTLN